MECTQRLECTQSNYETDFKKTCPEEIGFLGICGAKYPIKIGPNKIGRDPQTCNIVLSQNSISRQHAVINIINKNNFMLMDLDSANKTKLLDKTLHPYLPNPLRNGDTVQFGDVFGIFRVLEEDEDLPMTQAIEIPVTPMHNHYISRINKAPITMVPESPDVSDRDDSFVAPSQTKERKESNGHFIKPSAKTTAIQPIGSNKIDNIYWNSSKKSLSISPNNSSTDISNNNLAIDIHDMETQEPCPKENPYADQIYEAETQMPENMPGPSIYSQATQEMPIIKTNILGVRKVSTQQEMQIDLFASNIGNGNETHTAKSKPCTVKSPKVTGTPQKEKDVDEVKNKTDLSDKMLFDEENTQSIDGPKETIRVTSKEITISKQGKTAAKREKRITSSDSTDCEDIDIANNRNLLSTTVSQKVNIGDGDDTDCEDVDISIANKVTHENQHKKDIKDMPTQLFEVEGAKNQEFLEDMPTQMLETDEAIKKELLEDMPTQMIEKDDAKKEESFENILTQVLDEEPNVKKSPVIAEHTINFENLPTQVLFEEMPAQVTKKAIPTNIEDDILTQVIDEDLPTQVIEQEPITEQYSQEVVGPFKIPSRNVLRNKQIEVTSAPSLGPPSERRIENEKYYQSTQDVLDDLCSQRDFSPEIIRTNNNFLNNNSDDVLKSKRGYNAKNDKSQIYKKDGLTSSSESEAKVNQYVNNLSKKEIRDVIGVNSVKKLKRMPSDSSDDDVTPRKTLKFTESDLPNSQEIKRLIPLNPKDDVDVILSDSDTENESKQSTPEIFCKKIKKKMNMQESLKQMLNADALPTRIMTRVRKPSDVVKTSEEKVKNAALHMLKPKIFVDLEAGVDIDIVKENISRLKKTKSNIKSYFKVSDKSDTRNTAKPNERLEISNNSKSETSIIQKSEVNTSNTTIQSNKVTNPTINQKTENTRSTRSRRIKDNDKDESTDTSKCQIEKKTRRKKTSKSKEVEKSQANLDATANSNTSVRRTRRITKEKVEKTVTPKSSTSDVKPKATHRKREKKAPEKDTAKADPVQETEVRRSKRQRVVKDTKENSQTEIKPKSILKKAKYDQSTVYNNSSGSSTDSPMSIKRTSNASSEATMPMKTRSTFDPNCTSLRPTKTHYVLYTSFSSAETQAKLEKLGAVTVTDVTQCTVVMTCSVRRTFKLLCAVGLGRPVVGLAWLQACMDTKTIVDPWLYILKDEVAEKKYKFDLKKTLTGKRNYLKGYRVSSTPNVTPNADEMKQIVECSGGWWGEGVRGAGGAGGARWVCVTCVADKALWGALRRRGAALVTPEFILTGVMQQRADVAANSYASTTLSA